ncbi:MAG TPA: magnesium transporter [Natronosporangium sp.]|nr:magnesium transporter [Natronosporangium sp.]
MVTKLRELTHDGDLASLREWLAENGTLDITDTLARLSPAERAVSFRLLDKDRALAVFEALDPLHQQQLLEGLRDERVRELFGSLEADDQARLLDEVPAAVAARLQAGLPPEQRAATAALLGYPAGSAGRIMTPDFTNVRASMTAADALAKLRRAGRRPTRAQTLVLPVTDDQRRLIGVVDLADLVTAAPTTRIRDLMQPETQSVRVDDDQEYAARLMQEADLIALPVVDREDRLVGMITVDDAMEVLEVEGTRDFSRAGGAEPLEQPYLSAGVLRMAGKRAPWLLMLGVAMTLTVVVLQAFENALAALPVLAFFIPLLIGTGGNSGAQAVTLVVRAMAVGEVRPGDLFRIVFREIRVGVLLGGMLAALAFPIVAVAYSVPVGAVVGLTLIGLVTWASLVGGMLPLLARKIGIDPAVVSSPMVTTLVDTTGVLIYFLIAYALLGNQLSL